MVEMSEALKQRKLKNSDQISFSLQPFKEKSEEVLIRDLKGDKSLLDLLKDKGVSVVGSRSSSDKGLELARVYTEALVEEGYVIVSGLALGIDTVAHKTALEKNGKTVAVLGTPLGRIYPAKNKHLAKEIEDKNLILTTAEKHETFGKHLFLRRNKYMAENSKMTLVVEAGEKSGVIHQCAECRKRSRMLIFSDHLVKQNHKWVQGFIDSGAIVIHSKEELINKLKTI